MPDHNQEIGWLPAAWPAPAHVHAGTTTRTGGASPPPYDSFNLAGHVGDNPASVERNRKLLCAGLGLATAPCWLQQQHGNRIVGITESWKIQEGDGSYTDRKNRICAVLTADCLPLLLCDTRGTQISAVHVGWRGYSKNIIAHAISRFSVPASDLLAWIGPCISAQYYEVGAEVRAACAQITGNPDLGLTATRNHHWLADLVALAKFQLQSIGVKHIHGGECCSYAGAGLFYSYRRDGTTGRMASLIWME